MGRGVWGASCPHSLPGQSAPAGRPLEKRQQVRGSEFAVCILCLRARGAAARCCARQQPRQDEGVAARARAGQRRARAGRRRGRKRRAARTCRRAACGPFRGAPRARAAGSAVRPARGGRPGRERPPRGGAGRGAARGARESGPGARRGRAVRFSVGACRAGAASRRRVPSPAARNDQPRARARMSRAYSRAEGAASPCNVTSFVWLLFPLCSRAACAGCGQPEEGILGPRLVCTDGG